MSVSKWRNGRRKKKKKKVPDELQGPGALREQTITALSRCTTLFSSIISVHLHNTRGNHQTQKHRKRD